MIMMMMIGMIMMMILMLRWPRPRLPDVVRMETRFDGEFGMPSTHAMMSLSLPASIILFTLSKPYWALTVVVGM